MEERDLAKLGDLLEEAYHLIGKLRRGEMAAEQPRAEVRLDRVSEDVPPPDITPDTAMDAMIKGFRKQPEVEEEPQYGVDWSVVDEQIRRAREQLNRGKFGRNLRKAHRKTRRMS